MKRCIIVLGMHRSGTSALMGVLKALSIETGSTDLLVPSQYNPKGYFELLDIVNINDRILGSLHSSWDNTWALPENWWKGRDIDEYRKEISRIIKTYLEEADIISIKDPRICRLLPLWAEIFEELKVDTYYIIPLRNPLEIANSLKIRNGISLEKSLLLWMIYMLEAEFFSRKYPRVFITYDSLLEDASNTISAISRTLNLKFPKSYQDVKEDIAQFLDLGLRHHNQAFAVEDRILSDEILNFYGSLSRLAGKERTSKEDLSEIDDIRDRYLGLNRLFYNKDLMAEQEFLKSEKEYAVAQVAKYDSRLIYIPLLKKLERAFRRKFLYSIKGLFAAK